MTKNTLLEKSSETLPTVSSTAAIVDSFANAAVFKETWQIASALSKSQLIPQNFQARPEDCLIAIDMSRRIGASPMMILQNMYIVYGKPAWSSQFLIACLNSCGKFSPLRYKTFGTVGKDDYGVIAWAKDLSDGEILESPAMTIATAKKEGWYSKNGSKWQTMPDLMCRYRAATLFARLYAPELTLGMKTEDEVIDISPVVTERPAPLFAAALEKTSSDATPKKSDSELLSDLIAEKKAPVTADEVIAFVTASGDAFSFPAVKANFTAICNAILDGKKGE